MPLRLLRLLLGSFLHCLLLAWSVLLTLEFLDFRVDELLLLLELFLEAGFVLLQFFDVGKQNLLVLSALVDLRHD